MIFNLLQQVLLLLSKLIYARRVPVLCIQGTKKPQYPYSSFFFT